MGGATEYGFVLDTSERIAKSAARLFRVELLGQGSDARWNAIIKTIKRVRRVANRENDIELSDVELAELLGALHACGRAIIDQHRRG